MIDIVRMGWDLRGPVLIGYICVTVALILGATGGPKAQESILWRAFIPLSIAVLLILRLPSFFYNAPLNQDEAEFLANAIKFRGDMNTWLSVDTGSAGPADSYPLMWPFLFGADTGFFVARVTATVLLVATWLLFLAALASASIAVRIFTSAPLILFLGGVGSRDLLHYASELLPLLLLMCAMVTALDAVVRPPSVVRYSIAGLCLGLVPFAKLQASVVALALGAILFWQVVRGSQRPIRSGLWLMGCACLPAVAILAPLALAGGLEEFWQRYILWSKNYVDGGWLKLSSPGIIPPQLFALTGILHERLLAAYAAATVASAIAALVALPLIDIARDPDARREFLRSAPARRFTIVVAVFVLSLGSAIVPGRPFQHYAFLIVWPLALLAGTAWTLEIPRQLAQTAPSPRRLQKVCGVLTVLFVGAFAPLEAGQSYDPDVTGVENLFSAGNLLPAPDSRRGRVLVWGYAPELYVLSGWTPATRDILTYNEIWPKPNRGYFRDILMADLRRTPPEYVIDAVAPGSFAFEEPEKDGISTFPELAAFVTANYVLLSPASSASSCPRVFARRDVAVALAEHYAKPSRIYNSSSQGEGVEGGSASRVVDNITFESCSDAWLSPDRQPGGITLELATAQPIAVVELLNTKGGVRGKRASKTIRVSAFRSGQLVMDRKTSMLPFPYSTDVKIPEEVGSIDKLVLHVESYAGVGGGLNEIRLRKR